MDPNELPQGAGLIDHHTLAAADINQWIFDKIRPFVKGRILEIGSGPGSMSTLFVENGLSLRLSDADRKYCDMLLKKFQGNDMVHSVHKINFHRPDFKDLYTENAESFDTIVSLNVEGQIPIDSLVVANAKILLRNGGHLIMLSPAHTALYNGLGQDWNDWKKYNHTYVRGILGKGLKILKARYLNLPTTETSITYSYTGLSVLAIARKTQTD
jgi:2-polyprenyl-3-methyl-5-hydroxy-6-metoxy-1,4-benzoquinol methylase